MPEPVFLDSPGAEPTSIAIGMLQIRAVDIRPNNPFTWSSGWKSPIYCDNRLILSYPVLRNHVIEGFQSIVETYYPGVEVIAGAATGGIAHAAILADRLGLPTAYVRSSAKGHGRQRRVEGKVAPGAKAILIEDTLSTGKSAYEAVEALQEEGVDVLAVCAIFSYDFDEALQRVISSEVPAHRLLEYNTLIHVASQQGYIPAESVETLLKWRESPSTFG